MPTIRPLKLMEVPKKFKKTTIKYKNYYKIQQKLW